MNFHYFSHSACQLYLCPVHFQPFFSSEKTRFLGWTDTRNERHPLLIPFVMGHIWFPYRLGTVVRSKS